MAVAERILGSGMGEEAAVAAAAVTKAVAGAAATEAAAEAAERIRDGGLGRARRACAS